ncbi:MAG: amidohydrolase family protein [Gammaproteobacteria bacterium]
MQRTVRVKRLVATLAAALAISTVSVAAGQVAFKNVTVVDVIEGGLLHDQVVVVSGARIAQIAPAAVAQIPEGTRIVEAKGRFLIPGLWDMHAHFLGEPTPGCPEVTFPLAVAHGVTGARNLAAHLDYLFAWRAEVESGRMIGPRIIGTGPLIDGVPTAYPPASVVARTADDGRRIVDGLWRRGVDFIKAYEMLDRDAFFAIVDQARKRGLPVAIHVPLSVLAGEASDAGVRSFEHLRNLELACSRDADSLLGQRLAMLEAGTERIGRELRSEVHAAQRMRAIETYDPDRCQALLRKLAANGTWQTPTLFMETREGLRPDLREEVRDALRWVPSPHRAAWESWSKRISALPPEVAAERKQYADWLAQLLRQMKAEHIGLLAGTDIATEWTIPGVALHEELYALVEAGLTPLEALRAATWNAALFFEKTDEFGAVAPGRIADLVLLDANPLTDIRNTRRISGVVTNGRYLDRPMLDSLLATAESLAQSGAHDVIHRPGHTSQ